MVRFCKKILQLIDSCYSGISRCVSLCKKFIINAYQDTTQRARIFAWCNLLICFISMVIFPMSSVGVKVKGSDPHARAAFLTATFSSLSFAGWLVYAINKYKRVFFAFWCFHEAFVFLFYFLLTLSELVYVPGRLGLSLLILNFIVKLYGLWIVHICYLASKDPLEVRQHPISKKPEQDGMNIQYFVGIVRKATRERRGTEQSNLESTPDRFRDEDEDFGDSVIDPNSPSRISREFFARDSYTEDMQYTHILVPVHACSTQSPLPTITDSSDDNVINSELMCGGSSNIINENDSFRN